MIQKVRKFGFLTKGFIYAIIGILTFLAAFDLGGKIANKNSVISFLEQQLFGKILLFILGLGMLSYANWRFYKSFIVLKKKDTKNKFIFSIDYFFRGLIYASFSLSILYQVFNLKLNRVSKETVVSKILDIENGIYILYSIAFMVLISSLNQFYIAFSKNYLKNIKKTNNIESFEFLNKSGRFGITARGISFLIFSWFIFKASSNSNPDQVKGTQEMFSYLQSLTLGNFLMAVMAIGFISYGIFQYFYARYSSK